MSSEAGAPTTPLKTRCIAGHAGARFVLVKRGRRQNRERDRRRSALLLRRDCVLDRGERVVRCLLISGEHPIRQGGLLSGVVS